MRKIKWEGWIFCCTLVTDKMVISWSDPDEKRGPLGGVHIHKWNQAWIVCIVRDRPVMSFFCYPVYREEPEIHINKSLQPYQCSSCPPSSNEFAFPNTFLFFQILQLQIATNIVGERTNCDYVIKLSRGTDIRSSRRYINEKTLKGSDWKIEEFHKKTVMRWWLPWSHTPISWMII